MAKKIKKFFVFLFFSIFFSLLSGRIGEVRKMGRKQEICNSLFGRGARLSLSVAKAQSCSLDNPYCCDAPAD